MNFRNIRTNNNYKPDNKMQKKKKRKWFNNRNKFLR